MKRTRVPRPKRRSLPIAWRSATKFSVPIPKNDPERVATLHQFEILDTLPEEEFDNITLLASQICNTPIALISLVDSDRQWFKSRVGISFSETSRDIALCAHAIMQHDLFIISDLSKDKRFEGNPLVSSEPKLRFYAGAPLISSEDHALGTLCVMDRVPRELTTGQKEALRTLSKAVMTHLELRRRVRQLETELHQTADEKKLLKTSNRAVRSVSQLNCQFLAKAAHEVKTNARTIVAVMGQALQRAGNGEQQELLTAAQSSADALITLAQQMQDAAKRGDRTPRTLKKKNTKSRRGSRSR